MTSAQPIVRVESLGEFLAAARSCEKPVVYCLKENERYPCHSKWTNEYLETVDISVGIHRATKPSFFDFAHSPVELARSAILRQTTVGDLVRSRKIQRNYWEMISGTDTHLVLENGPVQRWSSLWSDCKDIVKLVPTKLYRVGFWISCGRPETGLNLSSQMHWDVNGHHNLNFQVRGEKSVIMFSPEDKKYLYPMPARLWHLSRIDPRKPADDSRPLFKKASPLQVTLSEGDVLLIPSGWWHHVTHKGEINVNLTFWYHSNERSGIKWQWRNMIVPNFIEAWLYGFKIIAAIVFLVPPMLLWEKLQCKLPSAVQNMNHAKLLLLVSLAILPIASLQLNKVQLLLWDA